MSAPLDCFKYAVGLSRTSCACFSTGKPTDYNTSESNLFIDEVEGLNLKFPASAADCSKGNLWELLELSREEGIKAFRTELMNAIGVNTVRRRQYFNGAIGDEAWSRSFQPHKNFAGLTWKNPIVRSGTMKIKRIGLFFNGAATFNLFLYNNRFSLTPSDLLTTWSVTSQANKLTWFDVPSGGLKINLSSEMVNVNHFWMVYDTSTAPEPMDSKISCGCGQLGQVNIWNTNAYSNLDPPSAKYNWLDWMLLSGTQGDLITKRDKNWSIENLGMGLFLDAEFTCKSDDLLCSGSLDFVNDDMAMVMAYAIRFKQAEILLELILASTNINRYTMLDRERLWGKRNHYRKMFDERILFLTDEYTDPRKKKLNVLSDCLMCRNSYGFGKGQIKITEGDNHGNQY